MKIFKGFPWTRKIKNSVYIHFYYLNPIWWMYFARRFGSIPPKVTFLWGLWETFKYASYNHEMAIQWCVNTALVSAVYWLAAWKICRHEVGIWFTRNWIIITRFNGLMWRKFARPGRKYGFPKVLHHKAFKRKYGQAIQGYQILIDHEDGSMVIATVDSEERALKILNRLSSVADFMNAQDQLGYDEKGNPRKDSTSTRPGMANKNPGAKSPGFIKKGWRIAFGVVGFCSLIGVLVLSL